MVSSKVFSNDYKCRVVNSTNVLWTCHKACKIEFGDCCYCICSVCYAKQTNQNGRNVSIAHKTTRKRRRTKKNEDDNMTLCNHNLDALVPFMDQTFFTVKYKETIRLEKYTLPTNCSICHLELVDKPQNESNQSTSRIVEI